MVFDKQKDLKYRICYLQIIANTPISPEARNTLIEALRRQLNATTDLHHLPLDRIAFDMTPGEGCVRVSMHSRMNEPGKWTNFGYAPKDYGFQSEEGLVDTIQTLLANGQRLPRKKYHPHRAESLFDYAA
ncbi:hypothetical protein HYT92_01215 [Candidatus Pacearchaeota archaeon]|nr:hypothetical protein [Candidatus Pacearchaeota archaeon]